MVTSNAGCLWSARARIGSMVAYLVAGQGKSSVPHSILRVDVCLVLDEGADYVDETTRRRLRTSNCRLSKAFPPKKNERPGHPSSRIPTQLPKNKGKDNKEKNEGILSANLEAECQERKK